MLGDTAVGWKSSTQKCVTTATCEAEYVALCDASKEVLFTRAVSVFLQPELSGMRIDHFGDNEGSKAIADNNPSSASRSKHITQFHPGIDPHGGSQNFARRNRRTAYRCPDEDSLEKEISCSPRGVGLPFLASRRVFCCNIISSQLEHFRPGVMRSNTPF